MARKNPRRLRTRLFGAVLLLALAGGGYLWWDLHHWQPPRAAYPMQGLEVSAEDGEIDWTAAKATGADFAYLDASASAFARDPAFVKNAEEARAAKLQIGAVHRYDPCQPADKQAANFVTVVARDKASLPPAVELDILADDCPIKVSDAMVLSELTTFLNQIETHTGKPAMLKLSRTFEGRYHVAKGIDRNLWLLGDRFQPDYAGRPWTMWTANSALNHAAAAGPVQWVVVQP
ncbi:glycoside hydrolase family 25 protein [Novosphingobium sp. B 225]|uniref:glycoside hydrolase family 25 protein n=1 Tax=Novosphingobium sp. B 225 TaxID=1961849 RepID=UPI000B4B33DD|nr:glycoside hydrolase family 25 protein [Novosphingobium sp. B 225]